MVLGANTLALRTRIAHFRDYVDGGHEKSFEYLDDGVIVIEDGKVKLIAATEELSRQGFNLSNCEHLPEHLCCPGFIDAHVHAGQLDIIASYGKQLLEWLEKYTFPAELRFADPQYAQQHSERFIQLLLRNGITSALVFSTRFSHHTELLFKQAEKADMRLIAGRVMMDRNAPAELCDTAEIAEKECRKLIHSFHQHKRLGYAITPRFAGTSTREQLKVAGELLQEFPDLWLQTHLSENHAEIRWTKKLFPEANDYLDVYQNFGLVGKKSIFAHCVHLSESETKRLASSGASIAFCPSSNCFLGSGLFPYEKIKQHEIHVALASDVGAGTSLSPFATMADAYKVCQLNHYSLAAREAYYLSTLGAARSLQLDKFVGSLCPGKEADMILINPQRSDKVAERIRECQSIDEELFAYMFLGDERIIERTYLHGKLHYSQAYNK